LNLSEIYGAANQRGNEDDIWYDSEKGYFVLDLQIFRMRRPMQGGARLQTWDESEVSLKAAKAISAGKNNFKLL